MNISQQYVFSAGKRVPFKPLSLWQVHEGVIKLTTLTLTGEELIIGLVTAPRLFGLPLSNLSVNYQATTLSTVLLSEFTLESIDSSTNLAQKLFPFLIDTLKYTESSLAIFCYPRVEERLRVLFLLLKQNFGVSCKSGTYLSIRLTHEMLANLIGSTRVSVTRAIKQFKEEGWLHLDDKGHFLLS